MTHQIHMGWFKGEIAETTFLQGHAHSHKLIWCAAHKKTNVTQSTSFSMWTDNSCLLYKLPRLHFATAMAPTPVDLVDEHPVSNAVSLPNYPFCRCKIKAGNPLQKRSFACFPMVPIENTKRNGRSMKGTSCNKVAAFWPQLAECCHKESEIFLCRL